MGLALYKYDACGYCQSVLRTIATLEIEDEIELRDTLVDPTWRKELVGAMGRGTVPVLTWSGLRGGISVALVLSLPQFPGRDTILTVTYVVVLFSILAQGLTVRRVVTRLLGTPVTPGKHGVV